MDSVATGGTEFLDVVYLNSLGSNLLLGCAAANLQSTLLDLFIQKILCTC